jgi:hemoglobin/transferrin/lactoferrin receptor protein
MQKILFKPNERISHLLNIQHSGTGNVPRYDRLQDVRNSNLRFAEWHYGPQLRSLAAYQFKAEGLKGFFNEINSVASYQWIEESRITREYKRYDRQDKRIENIGVVGFTLDGRRKLVNDEVVTGIDIQLNDLQSRATRTNLLNGQLSKLDTRYPDGKNTMNYAAAYIESRNTHSVRFAAIQHH